MAFGLVAVAYIIALIFTIALIFLTIFHVISFDELKTDYKNPVDQCKSLNPLVLPEYIIHATFTFLFILTLQIGTVFFNIPLLAYHCHRYAHRPVISGPGLYDPTTIMNTEELNRAMREGWVKLAFYIISFFYYLYGMSLLCSLSNEVPEHPVVSPRSGHIFERRLIEKYLAENGTDPINQQPLAPEELIDVKVSAFVRPKPPSATSIPAILKTLQDEWDAVMLQSFTLRQQLQTARQELSHALYQHDAACRVIARLTKEVTAAREALATLKPQAGILAPGQAAYNAPNATAAPAPTVSGTAAPAAAAGAPVQHTPDTTGDAARSEANQLQEEIGISEEVINLLQERATQLTAERKRRGKTVPEGLARARVISEYQQMASHVGLHSASMPGILSLDISKASADRIVTGGNDKNAVVFNLQSAQVISVLRGHTKKVTSVVYHPAEELVFTGSPDSTLRVWGVEQGQCASVIRAHVGPVTGLSIHATGDYLLSCSADGQWAFSDLRHGRVLVRISAMDKSGTQQALTCAQFHPDGLILGTGTGDGEVKIWDVKERRNIANFGHGSGANQPVTAIAFSENGYYLATGGGDGQVKLWDLRKLKNFKTLVPDEEQPTAYEINAIEFDHSGSYLAIAGSDVRVYLCKQWDQLALFNEHTAPATGCRFGENANKIVTVSLDRSVKVYGTY